MTDITIGKIQQIILDSVLELMPAADKSDKLNKFVNQLLLDIKFKIIADPTINIATPTVERFKSAIRPLFTFWFLGFLTMFVVAPDHAVKVAASLTTVPSEIWIMLLVILTFWFGGKTIKEVLDSYQGRKK